MSAVCSCALKGDECARICVLGSGLWASSCSALLACRLQCTGASSHAQIYTLSVPHGCCLTLIDGITADDYPWPPIAWHPHRSTHSLAGSRHDTRWWCRERSTRSAALTTPATMRSGVRVRVAIGLLSAAFAEPFQNLTGRRHFRTVPEHRAPQSVPHTFWLALTLSDSAGRTTDDGRRTSASIPRSLRPPANGNAASGRLIEWSSPRHCATAPSTTSSRQSARQPLGCHSLKRPLS